MNAAIGCPYGMTTPLSRCCWKVGLPVIVLMEFRGISRHISFSSHANVCNMETHLYAVGPGVL